MADFPALAHVAVTVTDLDRSIPWYTALFGSDPVLDEDTGPFRHVVWAVGPGQLVGLHAFPDLAEGTGDCPRGCSHDEPECALDDWVAAGHSDPARLASLRRLLRSRTAPEED